MTRDGYNKISLFDGSPLQFRWVRPRLNPMRLHNELRPLDPRDQRGERRHEKMSAENQIDRLAKCCSQGGNGIPDSPSMCAQLSNPSGWLRWIGCLSRQNGDRREDVHFRDRPEEVAVDFGECAPAAISIGHESKHAG